MKKLGRPKLAISSKKEPLLSAASELFRTYGFEKVSVDEICNKARVSKMTFYRQFQDKGELGLHLVEKCQIETKELARQILAKKIPFNEKYYELLQLNVKLREKVGLLFIEDLTRSSDPKVVDGLKNLKEKMVEFNLQFMEKGKSEGFLNPNIKSEFMLLLGQKLDSMIRDADFIELCPDFSERIQIVTDFFYFGVTVRKKR